MSYPLARAVRWIAGLVAGGLATSEFRRKRWRSQALVEIQGRLGIARVELGGDEERLRRWPGSESQGLEVR